MVVTLALLSILMAMSAGALSYYFSGRSLDTSARELTSQIRETQAMALATGNTYRIDFNSSNMHSYNFQRRQGSEWITVRGPMNLVGGIVFASSAPPSFGDDGHYMECDARGTCEDGQVVLEDRFGRNKVVQVEGETANVNVI